MQFNESSIVFTINFSKFNYLNMYKFKSPSMCFSHKLKISFKNGFEIVLK